MHDLDARIVDEHDDVTVAGLDTLALRRRIASGGRSALGADRGTWNDDRRNTDRPGNDASDGS
jgi:hypothetical protein